MSEKLQGSLRLVLVLVAIALLIGVAVVLWRPGGPLSGSPQPSDSPMAVSPLPSPSAPGASEPPPETPMNRAAALLWVVLGGFLALVLAFIIVRRHRQDEQ